MESNNNDFNNNLAELLQLFHTNEKMSPFLRNLKQTIDIYNSLAPVASRFDFNNVPHNGVRSLMKIIERYVQKITQLNNGSNCNAIISLFYSNHFDYARNIEDAENTSHHLLQLARIVHKRVQDKDSISTGEVIDMISNVRPEVYKSWLKLGTFWLSREAQRLNTLLNYTYAFALGN